MVFCNQWPHPATCTAQTPRAILSWQHSYHFITSPLLLSQFVLLSQGNTAHELGGALYSIQPSISIEDRAALNKANNVFTIGDLYLDMVNMTLNTANQGGCMYVTGNGANVSAVNSYFDRSESAPSVRVYVYACAHATF